MQLRFFCFSWGYFLPRLLPLSRTLLFKQFTVNRKIIQRKNTLYKSLDQTTEKEKAGFE